MVLFFIRCLGDKQLTWQFEWWVNISGQSSLCKYRLQYEIISFGLQIHGSSTLYYLHTVSYIFIILWLLLWQDVTLCGIPLSMICHHPLCFPVVFWEEGINQMLCYQLLTEPGRLSLLWINTISELRSAQATLTHGESCGSCSKYLGQGCFPAAQCLPSKPASMCWSQGLCR